MLLAFLLALSVRFLMPARTPQQVASQWATRLGQSGTKIKAGVQNVTTSPGALAARQKDVWAQNVAAAKTKWASRLSQLSTAQWQTDMITKGIPRIASGAQAAESKVAAFMTRFLPFVESARNGLPPRGNLEQNIARMTTFVRKMSTFRNTGAGA